MRSVGFIKSDKENENRIALYPEDIKNIKYRDYIFVEKGYGEENGFSDQAYIEEGIQILERNEILKKDIIVDPKIGDAQYLGQLKNQIIFGWIHAIQNKNITDTIVSGKLTAFAWEDMFENNRHVFWKNNQLAGEAAIIHAIILSGAMPDRKKAAIIGNGNTARGAYKILSNLGCEINVYTRQMERLIRNEVSEYDIIVNAVLWDTSRKDHIIYKDDLLKMKKGALIIDISCDNNGAIESSHPTTIKNPIFTVNGIVHYAVDHTPSLIYKTVSKELSKVSSCYINELIIGNYSECLEKAKIIENGKILDSRINKYQCRG